MPDNWPDGEGPSNPKASKEHADKVLRDPKHHAEKGSKRDLQTVDGELPEKEKP